MKRLGVLLSIFFSIVIILIGYLHWNDKLETTGQTASIVKDEKQSEGSTGMNGEAPPEKGFKITRDALESLVANLPEGISNQFLSAYDNGQSIKMLIVGSPALESESNGWSIMVREQLKALYGADFLEVDVLEFDGTSTEFVQSNLITEIAAEEADLILLESFTLEDNGLIDMDTSQQNIEQFIRAQKPNTSIIMQPPHPIYAANYYPVQVEAIATFAETEGIPYINHWTAWPDPNSEEILNYLDDESMPNEEGHALWAQVIIDYFSGR